MSRPDLEPSVLLASPLQKDGFAIVPNVLDDAMRLQLVEAIEASIPANTAAGVRGLADKVPVVAEIASSACVD